MSWILIGTFLPLALFASMSFNIYVLTSLFTKENSNNKPFKIGMSAVFGLVFTFLIIKGQLFNPTITFFFIYGASSGLLFGIYKEAKRFKKQLHAPLMLNSSEVSHDQPFFSVKLWLSSTFRFLIFVLLGLIVTYGLIFALAFLLDNPFFVR